MAIKRTGISRDLIIHPGETISDIIEERNITKSELAIRTGVSATFVGNVIAGKKNISSKFAMALEYALDIPKSFWLNLQAIYDAEILEADEASSVSENEKIIFKQLKDIVKYLKSKHVLSDDETPIESILSLRKVFRISSLDNLGKIPEASAFRISTKDQIIPCVLGAWIRLCQIHEHKIDNDIVFNPDNIDSLVNELKTIMLQDTADFPKDIQSVLSRYGLDFEIVRHFRGAPVQGFLYKKSDNGIKVCVTIRQSFADIFWFSLFHELGHLYNGDLLKSSKFLDDGFDKEKEAAADHFASTKLLDNDAYIHFVSEYKTSPSYKLIEEFASQQRVKPFIVIGRMQKEKIINYNMYSSAKTRYKWAE